MVPRAGMDSGPSRFLATIGAVLLAVSAVGFLMKRAEALVGAFLIAGVALCLVSVLAPRLEGPVEITLTSAKLQIAQVVRQGEAELSAGTGTRLEEIR